MLSISPTSDIFSLYFLNFFVFFTLVSIFSSVSLKVINSISVLLVIGLEILTFISELTMSKVKINPGILGQFSFLACFPFYLLLFSSIFNTLWFFLVLKIRHHYICFMYSVPFGVYDVWTCTCTPRKSRLFFTKRTSFAMTFHWGHFSLKTLFPLSSEKECCRVYSYSLTELW